MQIVAACLVGIITGGSVVLFNDCVHLVQEAVERIHDFPLLEDQRGAFTLLVPAAGGAAVTLIQRAAGGFEPTIRRANTEKDNQEWRDKAKPFLKSAAAVATLGTGASLGPEGPSVEIGTNCAALLFNSLRVPRRSKVPIIAAGSAAGLSAGFNAPIAGAFFAVEYVLQRSREKGEYGAPSTSSTTIAMVLLSAVLAAVVSQIGLGSEPAFKLPAYEQIRLVELPLFMLLGVLSGATSSAFLQGSKWFGKLFQRLEDSGIPRSFHPAIGGFCTGSIALWYPQVLYAGFTNVNAILDASSGPANYTWYLLLQIASAKIVATCVCRSSGLVGGIYAPSLFLGAAVGCSYGSLALFGMSGGMHDFASFDSYAIVGMASMLAGICRVPLTSVLLMFELTRDYNILLPSLAAVGLSYWVASFSVPLQERDSEAGPLLAEEGEGEGAGADLGGMNAEVKELAGAALCRIDSEECSPEWGMEELAMRTMTCGSVAIRGLPVFDPGTGLVELGARMLEENADCAAVVERGTGAFLGLCTLDQVERSLTELFEAEGPPRRTGSSTASALVVSYPRVLGGEVLSVSTGSTLARARTLMLSYDTDHLAVLDPVGEVPVLLGALHFSDLRRACRQHVVRSVLLSLAGPRLVPPEG